jgi:meso-butanediol dehydrogenase/(S,S)-butanediol dehydrogenase/diacetyl reductase
VRLEGKVAIVTGGGTGIGAATARRFAQEGARVVVSGRREEPVRSVAHETGGVAVPGDAADPADVSQLVRTTLDSFGRIDIVIANAAIALDGAAGDLSDESWRRTLDVNVTAPLLLVRAALPSLQEHGNGAIVLVSSVSGLVSSAGSAAYVTSKTALLGLMRSLVVDYGPRGIRTNAVCPGWVVTPLGDVSMDELAVKRGISRDAAYLLATGHVPARRPATAEEIAACCLFLASDDASIVNGATLVADGGQMAVDVASLAFDDPSR